MVLAGSLFQFVSGESQVMVLTLSPLRLDNSRIVRGRQCLPVPVQATIRQNTGGHSLAMSSQLRFWSIGSVGRILGLREYRRTELRFLIIGPFTFCLGCVSLFLNEGNEVLHTNLDVRQCGDGQLSDECG